MRLINGDDLIKRGVIDLRALRPVLSIHADPFAANATLRKDEWEKIDDRVNQVMRERLTIADDMRSRGLVQNVSLGTFLRVTERLKDFGAADISFHGDVKPSEDRVGFDKDTIPVPVISKDFQIDWRELDASRTRGDALDVTAAEQAARKVRDSLQDLITNGLAAGGPQATGGGIPGLTTASNRITMDLVTAWDNSGANPVEDVRDMLALAYGKNFFGPFVLYVPKNYWAAIQADQTANLSGGAQAILPRTWIERINAFEDIQAVRPNDSLADDNVVLVQMTREVLDLTEAQAVTTVQWEKNPFTTLFRVLMVGGPQIKNITTTASGGSTKHGIVHLRTP